MLLLARDRSGPFASTWRSRALTVAATAALVASAAGSAFAEGSPPTTCAHLCAALPQNCVVTSTVTVVPGSIIDCGIRDVQVTGGDLVVHDGRFELRAG